jgi:serine/threonine protein kinase
MIGCVILIEQLLKKHLIDKYGDFTPVRLTGGYTNETFLLNGTRPPLVVKVANPINQDIQNEINCLNITQETGVVPKFYDLIQEHNVQITVMEYREGQNGQSILDNNDLERTKVLYKSLGKVLSECIHSRQYDFTSNGIKECDLQRLNLDLDFVPEILKQNSKEILGEINDTQEEWV